jgi:membrane-anchored glycerophosphoryl diester phosphodiesterase (GDPDase)
VKLKSFRFAHIPLLHLLWEAHILPTHFVLMLLFSIIYTAFTPVDNIHPYLLWAFTTCTTIRNASFIVMQVAFTLYDSYHHLCVTYASRWHQQ